MTTDEFGGVAVTEQPTQTDEFGGVAVMEKPQLQVKNNPLVETPTEAAARAHRLFPVSVNYNIPIEHVEAADNLYGRYIGNKPDEFKTAINNINNEKHYQAIGARGEMGTWQPPDQTEQDKVLKYRHLIQDDHNLNTKFMQFWLATDQAALNGTDLLKHIVDPETRAAIKAAQEYNQKNPGWVQDAGGVVGGLSKIIVATEAVGGAVPLGIGLAAIAHVPTDEQLQSEESLGGQYGKEFLKGVATGFGFQALDPLIERVPFIKTKLQSAITKAVVYGSAGYGQTYAETGDKRRAGRQGIIMGVMGLLGDERQKEDLAQLKKLEPKLADVPDEQIIETVSKPENIQEFTKLDTAEGTIGETPENKPPTIAQDASKVVTPANVVPETDQALKIGEEMLNKAVPPEGTPKPAEAEEPKLFSLKNEMIDEKRKALGLEPLMEAEHKANKETWNEAGKIIENDDRAADKLITELSAKQRTPSDVENAILLHKEIELNTKVNELANKGKSLAASNDEEAKAANSERFDAALEEYKNFTDLKKLVHTEAGRSLQSIQMMAKEDYTLAPVSARVMTAKRGKLTPKEQDSIKQNTDRIAELESKIRELEQAKDIRKIAKRGDVDVTSPKFGSRNRLFTKEVADTATKNLQAMMTRLNVGFDPTALLELGKIGGYYFEGGLRDFGSWSKTMVDKLGDKIKPYLDETWQNVKNKIIPTEREDIVAKISKAIEKKGNLKDAYNPIGELGRNLVEGGIRNRDELHNAILEILKPIIPDITIRDVKEAITKYGEFKPPSKEEVNVEYQKLKGQTLQVLKLEDIRAGKVPLLTGRGYQAPDVEERALIKQVNEALKESGLKPVDEEAQTKTALETKKTRLKNQIEDLTKQIESRTKTVKGKKITPEDAESKALTEQRDKLKEQYDDIFGEGERLQALKNRLAERTAELQNKIDTGDFAPKPKKTPIKLDPEATALTVEKIKTQKKLDQMVSDYQMAHKSPVEKASWLIRNLRQFFIFSSPSVMEKLSAAAITRQITTPVRDMLGAAYGLIDPSLAARSPRYGRFSLGTEWRAQVGGIKNVFKDIKDVASGGIDIDILYSKHPQINRGVLGFFGKVHAALKTIPKRSEFIRSYEYRMKWNEKSGIDITNPLEQARIGYEAYEDAQRAVFQNNDNIAVKIYQGGIGVLSQMKDEKGKPLISAQVAKTLIQTELPVVNVPTNIVSELLSYQLGYLEGVRRPFIKAENMSQRSADFYMKHIAEGALGTALLFYGINNYQSIGGYYAPGEKRKKDDVAYGAAKVGDVTLPSELFHSPAGMQLQVGATIGRLVHGKYEKESDAEAGSMAIFRAFTGEIENVPFVREQIDFSKLFGNDASAIQALGDNIRGLTIPQLIQWEARREDKDVTGLKSVVSGDVTKRKPSQGLKGILENVETGMPVLRKNVPKKEEVFE